jgi:hypothetical protein
MLICEKACKFSVCDEIKCKHRVPHEKIEGYCYGDRGGRIECCIDDLVYIKTKCVEN